MKSEQEGKNATEMKGQRKPIPRYDTHFYIQYRKEIATHQEQMFLTVHKHPSNAKSLVIHTLP